MPGFRYSALLPPLSIALVVSDTERSIAFYRDVLDAEIHYQDIDFAAMRVGAAGVMLHADHTHDEHPWHEALTSDAVRGIGAQLRLLGIDRDTTERYKNRRAWDYDVTGIGFRDHMTNINAAIGLSQLARLDEFAANRRADCAAYDEAFADLDWLISPRANWEEVGPFIYTLRILDNQREAFTEHLKKHDVATGIHFLPCHDKSICKDFPRGDLSVTDRVSREIVTLPLWSLMPRETRDRVIGAVRSFKSVSKKALQCH